MRQTIFFFTRRYKISYAHEHVIRFQTLNAKIAAHVQNEFYRFLPISFFLSRFYENFLVPYPLYGVWKRVFSLFASHTQIVVK